MTPPTDSLEAALAESMERIGLHRGIVGDYDGAYDWVKPNSTDPDDALGDHPSNWPGESYRVVGVGEPSALAAAARAWMRQQLPTPVQPAWPTKPDMARWYNTALVDVAKALGL